MTVAPTVDFTDWAVPDLVLTLGGHTYTVRPPSVERARHILACTVRAEINLQLHPGPMPSELADVLKVLDETPLGVVTLGQDVYDQMVTDGHPPMTIDRVAYYAMFHWARGKDRADQVATALWAPAADVDEDGGASGGPARR